MEFQSSHVHTLLHSLNSNSNSNKKRLNSNSLVKFRKDGEEETRNFFTKQNDFREEELNHVISLRANTQKRQSFTFVSSKKFIDRFFSWEETRTGRSKSLRILCFMCSRKILHLLNNRVDDIRERRGLMFSSSAFCHGDWYFAFAAVFRSCFADSEEELGFTDSDYKESGFPKSRFNQRKIKANKISTCFRSKDRTKETLIRRENRRKYRETLIQERNRKGEKV